jgi:ketosteroid isomerase-like protein
MFMQSGTISLTLVLMLVFFSAQVSSAKTSSREETSAGAGMVQTSSAKAANATANVTALLQMQADAWNRGDLDTFVSGYLHSPEISYVSSDSEVWGYDALRDRYQRKYGDKHDTMGTLKFSDLKVQDLGRRNALCIGRWHLERSDKPTVDGIFSLVLVHTNSGWKIMHDHTSVSEHSQDKS